jgi:hypothetical protein
VTPRRASVRDAARRAAESPVAAEASDDSAPQEERFDYWDDPPPAAAQPFDPNRTLGEWLEGLIPPEAQTHFLNAGREFAAGVQVTIEHHMGRAQSHRAGAQRIDIE